MFTKMISVSAGLILATAAVSLAQDSMPTKFIVRIENISEPDAFKASDATKWSLAFSPGVAVVHSDSGVIFTAGKKNRDNGLEAQSEDGDPSRLAKLLESGTGIKSVTVFNRPLGATAAGPITPGAAYEFAVSGRRGDRLSITTMMGQSNDWFYAPNESGIELFKNGKPVSGDITGQFILWDAGTEVNQEPGIGMDQGPRQKGPNTGENENGVVRNAKDVKYGAAFSNYRASCESRLSRSQLPARIERSHPRR